MPKQQPKGTIDCKKQQNKSAIDSKKDSEYKTQET